MATGSGLSAGELQADNGVGGRQGITARKLLDYPRQKSAE